MQSEDHICYVANNDVIKACYVATYKYLRHFYCNTVLNNTFTIV